MRLAALASLEDSAEQADRLGRAESDPAKAQVQANQAATLRGMADNHLNEVEALATRMRATEPANAAMLLDYVRQAREYLRHRRAVSAP